MKNSRLLREAWYYRTHLGHVAPILAEIGRHFRWGCIADAVLVSRVDTDSFTANKPTAPLDTFEKMSTSGGKQQVCTFQIVLQIEIKLILVLLLMWAMNQNHLIKPLDSFDLHWKKVPTTFGNLQHCFFPLDSFKLAAWRHRKPWKRVVAVIQRARQLPIVWSKLCGGKCLRTAHLLQHWIYTPHSPGIFHCNCIQFLIVNGQTLHRTSLFGTTSDGDTHSFRCAGFTNPNFTSCAKELRWNRRFSGG